MRTNKVEFPSKKEAQQLKKSILDFYAKKPSTFCFSYEWMMGIVEPKTESEYIQNMFRFSTQGIVRRCDVYLPKVIEHAGKEYVVRLESYGDSKKTRMQAGVNPLAFAFGRVMLDYVYAFLEVKSSELEGKMKEKIEKQAEKERYYTAIQNINAFEGIFGKKMDKKKKEYQVKCDNQKKTISNALLSIKNMQINVDISKSNPMLSKKQEENGKNESQDGKNKKKGNKEQEKKQDKEEKEVDVVYDEDIDDDEEDIDMDDEDECDEEEEEDSMDEEEEAKMIAEQIKLIKQQNKLAKNTAAGGKPKNQSENTNSKPKSNGGSNNKQQQPQQKQDNLPPKKKHITKDNNNNKGKKNQNKHSNQKKKFIKK